ncbi:MAG: gliding motility-associated ABC transporter substrate-binding protein GldG [Cytophagaceae bacterium]
MVGKVNQKRLDILRYLLIAGILVFANIIFSEYFFRIDLTEDKRYSISPATKEKLSNLSDPVYIEVFLEGELTPDYERLKKSIKETLEEFRAYAGDNIQYRFMDPNAIEDKNLREQFFTQLVNKGVMYKYDLVQKGGRKEEKIVFPSALISDGHKEVPVMFLKGSKILPLQQQLNQSVEGVEFELMSALRKLESKVSKNLAFLEGHGEMPKEEVADISSALNEFYNVERLKFTDSSDLSGYDGLIIAAPVKSFSEREKFILDQYVVNGGRVLFFLDALNLSRDSLASGTTYGFAYNLGLDDLLFRYGVRLNDDIIQDLNCGLLKVEVPGGQLEMVSWPYYPIIYNFSKHPVVKNLDAIITRYAGSMDTVKAVGITKTPVLFTSRDTRIIKAPLPVDLNEARKNLQPKDFQAGSLPIAYILEGSFESVYKNRPAPIEGVEVVKKNKPGKLFVTSDADIIKNEVDKKKNQPVPLGYDADLKYLFSNKDFILNTVDFLMEEPVVEIRGKEIALRPLDKQKISDERTFWQLTNIVVPVILLIVFGVVRYQFRKKKYEGFNDGRN